MVYVLYNLSTLSCLMIVTYVFWASNNLDNNPCHIYVPSKYRCAIYPYLCIQRPNSYLSNMALYAKKIMYLKHKLQFFFQDDHVRIKTI